MENTDKFHPDNELFKLFCQQRREAVAKIYDSYFPVISRLIKKNRGRKEDVEDVFQEGVLVLLNYCRKENFWLKVPLKSFLYAVCKNIWLKKLKKKGRLDVTFYDLSEYVDLKNILAAEDEINHRAENEQLLWKYFNQLPPQEKKTLWLYYMEEKSHKEIAGIVGFSDEASARVQKFRYVRRLRQMVRQDPDFE